MSTVTFLTFANAALRRVHIIQGDAGALVTSTVTSTATGLTATSAFTDSGRQEQIDTMIQVCNETFQEMFTLPFLTESFDSILCHSLFTHLETEPVATRYLKEIKRLLKPQGLLWTTWFRDPPNNPCSWAERTVYSEQFIRSQLSDFIFLVERKGETTQYHDQWELLCRKN